MTPKLGAAASTGKKEKYNEEKEKKKWECELPPLIALRLVLRENRGAQIPKPRGSRTTLTPSLIVENLLPQDVDLGWSASYAAMLGYIFTQIILPAEKFSFTQYNRRLSIENSLPCL